MLFSVFHYLLEKYNFINLKSITNKASSEKVKKKRKKKRKLMFWVEDSSAFNSLSFISLL